MKKSKFSEEQVAYALRQSESGAAVADVCRQFRISEATFYVWKKLAPRSECLQTPVSARYKAGRIPSLDETVSVRIVATLIIIAAIGGFGWVFSLPSKSECVASGRVVDPTERHCDSGSGYVQLQEHALFHSREVVLGAAILLAMGYATIRLRRRRASAVAPPASPGAGPGQSATPEARTASHQ